MPGGVAGAQSSMIAPYADPRFACDRFKTRRALEPYRR